MDIWFLAPAGSRPGEYGVPPLQAQPSCQAPRHDLANAAGFEAGFGNARDPRAVLRVVGLANVSSAASSARPDERGRFRRAPQLLLALIFWRCVMTMTG